MTGEQDIIGGGGHFALPPQVHTLLACLWDAGYEGYLVGGCVRDLLLHKEPKDYDIATSARPEEMHRVFSAYRMIDTGIQHGTVTVLCDGMPFEVTTYRLDGAYPDGRHPASVTFTSSLQQDAARRDLTVNAMAYHPKTGVQDFFCGQEDLAAGRIRAVGDPDARFTEDALRVLRALRFASELDFTLEEATARAAERQAWRVAQVSAERIRVEVQKMLLGVGAPRVIAAGQAVLFAALPTWGKAVSGTPCVLKELCTRLSRLPQEPVLRWMAFLAPLVSPGGDVQAAHAYMERLRFDRRTRERVMKLLQHRTDAVCGEAAVMRRFLSGLGETDAPLLLAYHRSADPTSPVLAEAQACLDRLLTEERPVCTVADLALSGTDLRAEGYAPGRYMGQVLQALLEAVLCGTVPNERAALLAYAHAHYPAQG